MLRDIARNEDGCSLGRVLGQNASMVIYGGKHDMQILICGYADDENAALENGPIKNTDTKSVCFVVQFQIVIYCCCVGPCHHRPAAVHVVVALCSLILQSQHQKTN